MNRLLLLLCLSLAVFSCKSKQAAVTKGSNSSSSSKQVESRTGGATNGSKIYANSTERYIDLHRVTAKDEMRLYGIPASITLAQGILESGSGQARLALEANNHFGIKCHDWKGGKIYHDDDKKQECFRKYADAKYSFRDHSLFLTERDRYSKLFKLHQKDYTGWARGLRAAGYATDKKYPQKLISLIERYRLYELDEEVLAEKAENSKNVASTAGASGTQILIPGNRKVHTVSKGDTQYSISKKYNLTVKELQDLNGLKNTTLYLGQVLLIEGVAGSESSELGLTKPKSSNVPTPRTSTVTTTSTSGGANKKVHKVVKGDTQYSISKKYGLTVKELQSINGLKDTTLYLGQELSVVASPSVAKPTSTTPITTNKKVHKVVKGDTQYSISKKYGLTVKELQSLNGLKDTSLFIGQVLVVKPLSKN
nr:LysM peptidoglycan-binding domain-containing protein [Algibacter onchidii]